MICVTQVEQIGATQASEDAIRHSFLSVSDKVVDGTRERIAFFYQRSNTEATTACLSGI